MLKNLLVYRFLLVNLLASLAIIVAGDRGWVEPLYSNDFTYLTSACTILFAACWATTLRRVCRVSKKMNILKEQGAWLVKQGKAIGALPFEKEASDGGKKAQG